MIREAEVWVTPERDEDGFLPEGPREMTLSGRPAVVWVNIRTSMEATAGAIFARFWDTGEVRRFPLPGRPGFALPTDRPDTLLVGADKRLLLFNPLTGATEVVAAIPDDSPRTIINDGEPVPDRRGAVVFGTKDVDFADPLGHLYLFTADDRRVSVLDAGVTCSNGKVLIDDWLYDIDTPRRTVTGRIWNLADRSIGGAVVVLDLRDEDGVPDGLCAADDRSVIVAFYNPGPAAFGRAVRFDLASGDRLDEWRVPGSPRVTCPLLVTRSDGLKLVLTTATEGMPADQRAGCPHAGCLFLADAGDLDPPAADVLRLG